MAKKPVAERVSKGPNLMMSLFVLAVVIGMLVALGARQWAHRLDRGLPQSRGSAISAEATNLGYRHERDFHVDQEQESRAQAQALAGEPGAQRLWENAETGNRGIVWAAPETLRTGGATCRTLARRTLINGAYRAAEGTACRKGDGWDQQGAWRPVDYR
jgi:hypothetical protein